MNQRTIWSEGLPQSSATAIARTPDGYLWVGTQEAIARFDGSRFVVFDRSNTPAIPSNLILSLYVDRSGKLWIGAQDAVAVLGSWGRRGDWVGSAFT